MSPAHDAFLMHAPDTPNKLFRSKHAMNSLENKTSSYSVENEGVISAFFGVDFPKPNHGLFTFISFTPRCKEKKPFLGMSSLNVTAKSVNILLMHFQRMFKVARLLVLCYPTNKTKCIMMENY